jgi:lipopolysaccharide transport system permease protein
VDATQETPVTPAGTDRQSARAVVIKPPGRWSSLELGELWQYRELLSFLAWRDVLIRYKQAVLGVAWAVLNPLVTMVVFTLVFGMLLGVESGSDVPYAVFSYTALLPWNLFAGGLSRGSTSLVARANLLTKVYFPRLVIPLSSVLTGIVDFAIAFVMLLILMAVFRVPYTWTMLWVPLLTVLCVVTSLAVSLWLSALNVLYRDVQYIVPFLIQLWMYLSPVIYPVDQVPEGILRTVYSLNPMTGVIQGFRWAILGEQRPGYLMVISMTVVLALLLGGLFYFKRMERTFADVV